MFHQCDDISKGFICHNEYMNCHWKSIQTFEYIDEDTIIFSKIPQGLFLYNTVQKKEFELTYFNREIKSKIISIKFNKKDIFYCLDERGCLYEVDISNSIFKTYKITDEMTLGLVNCENRKEIFVLGANGFVYRFNTENKEIIPIKLIENAAIIAASIGKNARELYFSDENRNLYLLNLNSEKGELIFTFNSIIRSIEQIDEKILLLGTSNGHVISFNINSNEIIFDQFFHRSERGSCANVSKLIDVKLLDDTLAVSIGWNDKIILFSYRNGEILKEFSIGIPSALRISPKGKIGISECTYYDSHRFLKYHSSKEVLKPVISKNLPYKYANVIKYLEHEKLYVAAAGNHIMFLDMGFENIFEFDIPYYEDIQIQAIEYMRWGKLVIGDNYGFVHIYSIRDRKVEKTINTLNMNTDEFECDIYFMEINYISVVPHGEEFITLLSAMPDQSLDGLSEEECKNIYFSKLFLWDGKTGEVIYDFSEKNTRICQAEFISSSMLVYAEHCGKVRIFDIKKREFAGEYSFDSGIISSGLQKRFYHNYVYNNQELISFSQKDGVVVYSLKSNKLSVCKINDGEKNSNIITGNNRLKQIYVAFNHCTSSFVKVFDIDTKGELFTLEGFSGSIKEIIALEDLKYIVIADESKSTVWSCEGELLYVLEANLNNQNFVFVNRNGLIVIKQDDIDVFDLRNEENSLYRFIVNTPTEQLTLLVTKNKIESIESTIVYSFVEYQNTACFYKITKTACNDEYDALINLILRYLADVEEFHQEDLYNSESIINIINYFGKSLLRPWDEKKINVFGLKDYVLQKLKYRISIIRNALDEKELENSNITYPSSQPGLYVNGRLKNHYNYSIQINDDFLFATQLDYDSFGPGYETIFIIGAEYYYLYLG